jgi:hypothetical protein
MTQWQRFARGKNTVGRAYSSLHLSVSLMLSRARQQAEAEPLPHGRGSDQV